MSGRGRLALALALAVLLAPAAGRAQVESVGGAGFTVSDLDASLSLFRDVLGFDVREQRRLDGAGAEALLGVPGARLRVARLALGDESIELLEVRPAGRPIPADLRSDDLAFQHLAIVVADMDAAYARVREAGVRPVSTEPQTLPASIPAAAGIRAFYFRDRDGHNLELIWYPPDKGDPRWQARPPGRLFLGIDHTAIAVADTERSLAFWRDGLGLRVAGESENAGSAQEHLNGVPGARVRITGLRPAVGLGVELLDYLAPRGGRPSPADLRPDDLLFWHTTVTTRDAAGLCGRHGARAVALEAGAWGFARACLVRDPDGHFVRIAEP